MPKNIEDIIPSGRKSIRSIPVPARRAVKITKIEEPVLAVVDEPREKHAPAPRKRHSKRGLAYAGVIGLVVLGAFALLSFNDGATLAYTPKVTTLSFANDTYSAYQAPKSGQLAYSVIKLSGEKSMNVPATGEENVSVPASGRVVIYNEQSSAQPLVKTTRLESPDGKIYRIQEDVTIPAKGSLEVTAVADQPGPSYNIPLSDFTIPGFKGSAKYELVYARSKSPMSGGFTGMRKKVSEADLSAARTTLEKTLESELLSQARAQMPADFVLFPALADIAYEFLPVENAGNTSAKVTLRGNLSAAIFKKGDLTQHIVADKLGVGSPSGPVEITDFASLEVTQSGTQASSDTLRINVSGTAAARHLTDEAALATDLAGISKTELDAVLGGYSSIERASAKIRPFWESSFPEDVSKIKIEEQI